MFSFFNCGVVYRAVGEGQNHVKQSVGAACVALFCYHIWYLTHRHFDYGYNMKVNVTIGQYKRWLIHQLTVQMQAL